MMKVKCLPVCVALFAASLISSHAAVLVQYNFDGYIASDDAPYSASTVFSGLTAGGFTPAVGLGSNGNWNTSTNGIDITAGGTPPRFAQKPIATTTQALSLASDAYWSISLAPDTGNAISLTSLTFSLGVFNGGLRPSFYLASNIDGYATPIGSVTTNATAGTVTIDLSGAQFQNLASGTEFRLYLWSENGGGGSGSRWVFDDVTVEGTVAAVPEPVSVALFALGGLSVLCARRRRFGFSAERR
jgi:hypothetical protein